MEYAYYNLINYDGSFFMCGEGMVLFVKLVIREVLCLFMSLKMFFLYYYYLLYEQCKYLYV